MHIIEPRRKADQKQKFLNRRRVIAGSALVLLVAAGFWSYKHNNTAVPVASVISHGGTKGAVTSKSISNNPKVLKTYTGEQFKELYNNFAYPNVVDISTPPVISGNAEADKRMQGLAEERGYKLRSGPATALGKVDGFALQEKAMQPWLDMKTAAAADGIKLSIVSAFRSVDEQRALFLQRLAATGTSIEQVAAGHADNAVESVLSTSSLPGYSRHHTGYTFDLMCNGADFNYFATTPCYSWLSKNNYENAKKFGWIPSYPEGSGTQGPEPESWEYVWVGTDTLYQ